MLLLDSEIFNIKDLFFDYFSLIMSIYDSLYYFLIRYVELIKLDHPN